MNSKCKHEKTKILNTIYGPELFEWCEVCGAVRPAEQPPRAAGPWKIPSQPLPKPGDVIEFEGGGPLFLIRKDGAFWWASPAYGPDWCQVGWEDLSGLLDDMEKKHGDRYRIVGNIDDMEGRTA